MHKNNYILAQVALGITCAVLSFIITTQLISVKRNNEIVAMQSKRSEELIMELGKEKEKNADLFLQLSQAQSNLKEYQREAENHSDYNKILSDQLKDAEVLAGLTEVQGPGIKITITDSSYEISNEMSLAEKEMLIIHDSDLRLIMAELAAAGAEAYSINGERVVATTAIRCVGPVVIINDEKMAPPYEILAIGDPKTLEAAVNMRGGLADMFKSVGIEISVRTESEIIVPRFKGAVSLKHASPVIENNPEEAAQ